MKKLLRRGGIRQHGAAKSGMPGRVAFAARIVSAPITCSDSGVDVWKNTRRPSMCRDQHGGELRWLRLGSGRPQSTPTLIAPRPDHMMHTVGKSKKELSSGELNPGLPRVA